jgi:hypothetical protein
LKLPKANVALVAFNNTLCILNTCPNLKNLTNVFSE